MKKVILSVFVALIALSVLMHSAQAADAGQEFLAKKATESGVIKTQSGLLYKVLNRGSGSVSPRPTDRVTVHYRGTLIDGTEFDSSYSRGSPATFGVNQVIKGWTEALQLMKPGDKFELYIPSELAYGSRAVGSRIPPNSVLIFTVELLNINGGRDL